MGVLRVHRELADDGEVRIDAAKLVRDAHAHPVVDEGRAALGMEGDDVERRARPSVGVVGSRRGVLQERPQHALRTAGHLRTADPRRRQGAAHALDGEVVEPVELVAPCLRLLRRQRITAAAAGPTEPLQ